MTKAEKEARKAWIASLKVGDEVALIGMERGKVRADSRPSKYTVWHRNSMRISVGKGKPGELSWYPADACHLEADGFRMGNPHQSAIGIFPITDEILMTWKADECRQKLHAAFEHPYRSSTVTDDQAIRMCAILDEGKVAPC